LAYFWGSESAFGGDGAEFSDDGVVEDGEGEVGLGNFSSVGLVGGGDVLGGVDEDIQS
jgi:hypothetical protein